MKKPAGRPPMPDADRQDGHVHVRLPTREYDAAVRLSKDARISVPELFRRAFRENFRVRK